MSLTVPFNKVGTFFFYFEKAAWIFGKLSWASTQLVTALFRYLKSKCSLILNSSQGFVPSLNRMSFLAVLTLSLWNGFKKLPAISPSSRGVPGGLFMPAMLLGEFYNTDTRNTWIPRKQTKGHAGRLQTNQSYLWQPIHVTRSCDWKWNKTLLKSFWWHHSDGSDDWSLLSCC